MNTSYTPDHRRASQYPSRPEPRCWEAAKAAGIRIPTLCYLSGINEIGACRMCVVDTGARALSAACVMPVSEGMKVKTNTPAIREARRINLELVCCPTTTKVPGLRAPFRLQTAGPVTKYGGRANRYEGAVTPHDIDEVSPSIVRNNLKCVLCRRCVAVYNIQVMGVLARG